jgi:outer membrane receptor protein involved in Fe transport
VDNANAQVGQDQSDTPTEIIVQAQRREQRLTDVPMAVEVISAQRLAQAHVVTAKDLQILTPGLIVNTTISPNLTTARIRGIGTVGDNPGLESSVGIVVDGVYRSRNSAAVDDEIDLDHAEIIKGPQGTLYGKNTTAGLISLYSKKPSFQKGGEFSLGFGNFNQQAYALRVTGPLSGDELAGSLSYSHNEHGAFSSVVAMSPRVSAEDNALKSDTVKGQLLALPNDIATIRVIADYTRYTGQCCLAVQSFSGPTAAIVNGLTGGHGIAAPADVRARTAYANQPDGFSNTDEGVTILSDFKLGALGNTTLSSITGIRTATASAETDVDYTGADILYRRAGGYGTSFKTASQELRLHHEGKTLDQMLGFYIASEDLQAHDGITMGKDYETYLSLILSKGLSPTFVAALTGRAPGTSFAGGSGIDDHYGQTDTTVAAYYNADWRASDKIEVTAGVRYTEDHKKFLAQFTNTPGNVGCAAGQGLFAANGGAWSTLSPAQKQSALGALCLFWSNAAFNGLQKAEAHTESNVSGTAKAIYHFSDHEMAYLAWSSGYKAGGFNLDRSTTGLTPDASLHFAKETIEAIEGGFKASEFDRTLTFNVTPFYERLKNFQLNTFLGTAYVVETIPSMTSKGVDVDAYWRTPLKGLSIAAGGTYADTRYGHFTAANLINPSHFPNLSLLPGSEAGLAAKVTATLSASWETHLGTLPSTISLSGKYSDPYVAGSDVIPAKTQKGFTIANASWYVTLPKHNLTLSAWVRNLTDQTVRETVIAAPLQGTGFQTTVQPDGTYYNAALDTNTYAAFLNEPRTFGVSLSGKF